MTSELISNRGANEIGPIGIESVGDEQVYWPKSTNPRLIVIFSLSGIFGRFSLAGTAMLYHLPGWYWLVMAQIQGGPEAFFPARTRCPRRQTPGIPTMRLAATLDWAAK